MELIGSQVGNTMDKLFPSSSMQLTNKRLELLQHCLVSRPFSVFHLGQVSWSDH